MASKNYTPEHRRRRDDLLPKAWGKQCPLCGLPMLRGQVLELDHSVPAALVPGRPGDRIAHRTCNRRAGAKTRDMLASFRATGRGGRR